VNKQRALGLLLMGSLLSMPGAGSAQSVAQGENEVAGRLSYVDVDYGYFDSSDTRLDFSYGRYITDMHQLGVTAGYINQEVNDASVDGITLGAFYALHFPTSGILTPYIGLNAAWLGGDVGDLYDFQYGVGAGLKIYPYEHAGISVGIAYQRLQAAEDYIDDADGLSFGVGLLIRFGKTGSTRVAASAKPASLAAVSVETICTQPSRVDQAECRGLIRMGMTREEVLRVLGAPSGKSADEKTLRYGDRYLAFDGANRLIGISESKVQ